MIDDQMKQPLLIHIAKPCQENWDEMTEDEQGKFCSHCQKTVIDFSQKTDAELIDYFNHHSSFCGRFKNTQINRVIEEPKPVLKRLFDFYSKAAAVFFTLFSFKNSFSQVTKQHEPTEFYSNDSTVLSKEKVRIEGTVRDDNNNLLEGVRVKFDNQVLTSTDREGKYVIEIDHVQLKSHIIAFEMDDLIRDVYSFHPLMDNKRIDAILKTYKGPQFSHIMGMPALPKWKAVLIKNMTIEQNVLKNPQVVNFVNSIIDWSKWNPSFKIAIKLNYAKVKERKLYIHKGQEIIYQLAKSIDKERLQLKVSLNPSKANTLEMVDFSEEEY